MAQEQVNGIIQALIAGQQKRNEQLRLTQQQTQNEAENAYREKVLDETIAQHKAENTRADLSSKAADAVRQMQQLELQQKITSAPYSQIRALPGMTESPVTQSTPVTEGMHIEQTDPNTVMLHHPVLGAILHQTPLGEQQEITAREKAQQDPIEANRLASERQKAADDFARYNMQKEDDLKRATTVANINGRWRAVAAGINHANPALTHDLTPYLEGGANGTTSMEEISKLPKDDKKAVLETLSKEGFIPISEKQKQFVGGMGGAVQALQNMDEYLTLPKIERLGSAGSTLRNLINEGLVQSTNTMLGGSTNRLSQPRIEQMKTSYAPSPLNPFSDDKMKRDKFVQVLHNVFNTELSGLAQSQKDHLESQIGLKAYVGQGKSSEPKEFHFDSQGNQVP